MRDVLRQRMIQRVKRSLLQSSNPRLEMAGMLLATGAAGFLFSFGMLQAGITQMMIRYPLAVVLAYGVFLVMLYLWIRAYQRSEERTEFQRGRSPDDRGSLNVSGLDFNIPTSGSGGGRQGNFRFSGGRFGGGGASGSFDESDAGGVNRGGGGFGQGGFSGFLAGRSKSRGGSGGLNLDSDDWGAILIVIVLLAVAAAVLGTMFYVVYAAPSLLAEALVDGLLLTGLYRRVRRIESGNWLRGVLRKTWIPVVVVALLFCGAGYVMQSVVPEAESIGDVWDYVETR